MRKLVAFALAAISAVNCSARPVSSAPQGGMENITAATHIAPLPEKLDFAGEEVPLQYADVREALEREMGVTMYMHSRTLQTLRATKRYFHVIVPILKESGIPEDFKYLCMAESGLNPNAVSTAKAAGLWQFMTSAAKDFGVETGDNVDMRFHVEAATRAACKYLKQAYNRFGSWTLAAASYNVGQGGLSTRKDAQGAGSYYDLFLPEETMRYVYRILSLKIIEQSPADYGFFLKSDNYLQPFENYKIVTVSDASIDWPKFAASHGTNYKVLRILNPWIRSYSYANPSQKSYEVMVPTRRFREDGR